MMTEGLLECDGMRSVMAVVEGSATVEGSAMVEGLVAVEGSMEVVWGGEGRRCRSSWGLTRDWDRRPQGRCPAMYCRYGMRLGLKGGSFSYSGSEEVSVVQSSPRREVRGGALGFGLEVDAGKSVVSRSFGVGRRSNELEEAEVSAEVEEDDLPVEVDREEGVVVAAVDCCSNFAETASRFDVRRTVGVVDRLSSAF